MNPTVISAIFKRNFVSYFSNPTGYVFICVFVLASSISAFWPPEFFSSNLANLDQLNRFLPFIMLVFIPSITMSIWAEERRQGTDELLLTIPATDFDVVLGKYLAAVAIFSVSLVFSLVSNLLVLMTLGDPDIGLFVATYFGYWLVGLAMLAIGMVASFLTGNLTVGFILGMLFNLPLAAAHFADLAIADNAWAAAVRRWSVAEQFRDFGRGVIDLGSAIYFVMIVVVMLYLCMVLIGRRHWMGGRDGRSFAGHYLLRALSLLAISLGINLMLKDSRLRYDVTSERLSSLSPYTRELIGNLETKRPVRIEAYVSPLVPQEFVQTQLNLLSTLRELDALGGDEVGVNVVYVEPLSEEADRAEQQFGIKPQPVRSVSRGASKTENIYLGAVVMSGLEKVVVPFFDRGIPIEYELVRSIGTVVKERPRLGVLNTDAEMMGGFDMQTFQPKPRQPILDELEKQYEIVGVDANKPITEHYGALLVVQPSSLSQPQMDNLVAAVRNGQPTALFEDPAPWTMAVTPTSQPKPPRQMPGMGFGGPPEQKGDIEALWRLLGVRLIGDLQGGSFGQPGIDARIICQDYNPHPKYPLPSQFVFVGPTVPGADQPFNEDAGVTSGLQEMLFITPGAIERSESSKLPFTQLVETGDRTSTLTFNDLGRVMRDPGSQRRLEQPTGSQYVLAAHVKGNIKADDSSDSATDEQGKKGGTKGKQHKKGSINVVLVTDVDVLSAEFLNLRALGEEQVGLTLDNITFVLNTLDALSGSDDVVELRKRRPIHRTLSKVEHRLETVQQQAAESIQRFTDEFEQLQKQAEDGKRKAMDEARQRLKKLEARGEVQFKEARGLEEALSAKEQVEDERLKNKVEQLTRQLNREIAEAEKERDRTVREVQDTYKMRAGLIPPIFPLLMGFFVYFSRRAREREGVAKTRFK